MNFLYLYSTTYISIMIISCITLLASLFAFAGPDTPEMEWNELERGAQFTCNEATVSDAPQCISILRYRPGRFHTEVANDGGSEADSTSVMIGRHSGIAGINASYFNVRTLEPATYVKDDGLVEGQTQDNELFRANGMVAMKRHGKSVSIFPVSRLKDGQPDSRFTEAVCSGPILVENGREAGNGIWPDDTNLDGGGSSALWAKPAGVLSHPCDNKRFDHYGQRRVPNVIYIK